MSTTTSPPTTTPPPPPPTTTTPPPPPTTTTPPPTSTTPPPTTTNPPPSGCPCDVQTLSASITTKYFVDLLDQGSLFLFPIDIQLQKDPNVDCLYVGQVTTKLLFYDDSDTLDVTPSRPNDIKTATLSARLSWDDDLEVWDFRWSTNFQNILHNEDLTLSQETPSCPYGTFQSDKEDEVVCVKNPNSVEEIPNIVEILYYNEELFGVDLIAEANSDEGPLGNYARSVLCIPMLAYSPPTIKKGLIYRSLPTWLDPRTSDREINPKNVIIEDYVKIFELFINPCSGKRIFKIYTDRGISLRDNKPNQQFPIIFLEDVPERPSRDKLVSSNYAILDEESEFEEFVSQDNLNNNLEFIRIIPENLNTEKICGLCKQIYIGKLLEVSDKTEDNCKYLKDIYKKDVITDDAELYYIEELSNRGNIPILPLLNLNTLTLSPLLTYLITDLSKITYDTLIAPTYRPNGRRTILQTGTPGSNSPFLIPIGPDFGRDSLGDISKRDPYWKLIVDMFETRLTVKVPPPHNNLVDRMFDYAAPFVKECIKDITYGFGIEADQYVSDYYSGYVFRPIPKNLFITFPKKTDTEPSRTTSLYDIFDFLQNVNSGERKIESFKYQGYAIIDFSEKCVHFRLKWYLPIGFGDLLENYTPKDESDLRYYFEKDKFLSIPKFGKVGISFLGDDGDTGTVEINNQEFIVKNDNNQLIFDFEGDQEYTFTEVGDTHTITVGESTHDIVFDGLGSLLFSIISDTPTLKDFDTFITESSDGVDIVELEPLIIDGIPYNFSQNIEIGFNFIGELTSNKVEVSVGGIVLEIDEAYDKSLFCIIKKDIDQVIYFTFNKNSRNPDDIFINFYEINNSETKVCEISLLDHTKIPNTLPRITSSNGVEIVELTNGYTGISFDPIDDSLLTGNQVEVTVEGNVFLIDEAYDGRTFVLNELRTPTNNKSTLFTFLKTLNYGINVFRTSRIIDSEFLRMRLLGYF